MTDIVPIHRGALNLNSLAIIGKEQIIQQVSDQLDIDGSLYKTQQLIEMAKDPISYLGKRTGELNNFKNNIIATVNKTLESASKNSVPEEVCNYMAFEAAKQQAKMDRLLLEFKYPMSDTAVRITSSGKANMDSIDEILGKFKHNFAGYPREKYEGDSSSLLKKP